MQVMFCLLCEGNDSCFFPMAKKIDVGMVIAEKTAVIKPHVGGYPLARAEEEASD
jgi:hypothetical protein